MNAEEKRRSDRVVPVVSDEEMVVIESETAPSTLAKLLDFSEVGTLVYLLQKSDLSDPVGAVCTLKLYHRRKVFAVTARLVRKNGRIAGFEFSEPSDEQRHDIRTKLLRMEVDWLRLSSPQ